MENCEKTLKKWDWVFVVELWLSEGVFKAFSTRAQVKEIDAKNETIKVIICGTTYRTYSFKDFGRLIFVNQKLAHNAAKKYPIGGDIIYKIEDDDILEKKVLGIMYEYVDGVIDLFIKFEDGENISSKELGKTIFLKKEDIR